MKLKGIELKGTYKVKFANTFFEVYNKENKQIYFEDSSGYWSKSEHNKRNNQTYYENSSGYWSKSEFNESGNLIYFEDSKGEVIDRRVRELTLKEIEELLGFKIKIKGERK